MSTPSELFFIFLASGSALASSAMVFPLKDQTATLIGNGTLTCVSSSDDGNCALQGSYGYGITIMSLFSALFNGILWLGIAQRWWKMRRVQTWRAFVHSGFFFFWLATALATGVGGYNFYVAQNFGDQIINESAGEACPALTGFAGCERVSGSLGVNLLGTNATNLVTAGMIMAVTLTHFGNKHLRTWKLKY